MNYRERVKDSTYVFAGMDRSFLGGTVSVGGDPDDFGTSRSLARFLGVKEKGLFGRYVVKEDLEFPGDYIEVGNALTLSGARRLLRERVYRFAEEISKQTDLPIVNIRQAMRLNELADKIAVERMRARNSEAD